MSYWGPELEFYIFDDVRFDQTAHCGYYYIDSNEGVWNTGRQENPNLGYKLRHKEGYFPVPPSDTLQDVRSEIVLGLKELDVHAEVRHHEVGTAGQGEIDMRFATLTKMADNVMYYKYVVRNVSRKHGKTATFMPKPIFGDNGSGMHTHQSLWKSDTNLFWDEKGYAQISEAAKYYIGGLLRHAPALLGLCAPTTNSYRRLVPGFEAPVNLVYSQRNRSAAVRIPVYSKSPKSKRVEFRCPDPASNPYLCFAAQLMAGLDGIRNRIDPGHPIDKDLYELEPEEAAKVKSTPGSLGEVLDALEHDHDWGVGQVLPLKKDLSQLLQVGVIGYDQWQITANGGTFALGTVILPASTLPYYSVHAVGGQLNYIHPATNLLVFFKYEHEYKSYSHTLGNTIVFGGNWTLRIPKPAPAQ